MTQTGAGAKGFTLIELLIVIIIIGILAATAIPMYLSQREKAKNAAVKEGVHSIQVGIQSWALDNSGVYPEAVLDSTYVPSNHAPGQGSVGAYVDQWPYNAYQVANTPMEDSDTAPGDYHYTSTTTSGVVADFHLVGNFGGGSTYSVR